MRIYLTLMTEASSGFKDITWKTIFYNTLREMNHDVVLFTYDQACIKDGEKTSSLSIISENIYNHFMQHHKIKKFDIFFSYYHSLNVNPELFKRIKEKTFCVNYTTNFHQIEMYKPLLAVADLSIYASIEAKPYFDSHKYSSFYMPFAGLKTKKLNKKAKNGDISFIGTSYGNRPYYIWRLLQNNLPIKIYGSNWINNHKRRSILRTLIVQKDIIFENPSMVDTAYRALNDVILKEINLKYSNLINKPLDDKAYTDLLSNSSIVLNFPESRYNHDFSNPKVLIGANLRDFEVPALGSFLLTQDNHEINSFFTVKKEIETFKNEWEMVDKASFYLKNPSLSLKIAEAGMKRVNKQHLWNHRLKSLFLYIDKNFK